MRSKDGSLRWFSWNAFTKNGKWYADGRDITDSKKLDTILHDTQAMASVGGWELNLTTRQLFWTEQMFHIHQLPLDHPTSSQEAVTYYHPNFAGLMAEAVDKAISHHQPYDLELQLITAKGKQIWVRAIGKAVVEYNKVVKLIGTFQDITKNKETEEKQSLLLTQLEKSNQDLQQKEKYLKEINKLATLLISRTEREEMAWEVPADIIKELGLSSCSIFLLNDKKQYLVRKATYTSSSIERFVKATEKIPLGEGLIGTVGLNGIAEIVNDTTIDARFTAKATTFYSKIAVPIIADGTLLGVISFTHVEKNFFTCQHLEIFSTIANLVASGVKNATTLYKKKLIEQAFRESEAQTRQIIDTAMDGVIIMSSEGVISNWNNQAASIFGWSKQEAIGMDLALLIIPQAYREAHQQGLLHYIKTGESRILNRRVEVTALRKNGELFPLELTVSPVHSENGIRYSAFVRDISQRNQARQELEFISSRLTALIRNLQAGVMVEDDKGKVVITNQAMCNIFGIPIAPETLVGTVCSPEAHLIKHLFKDPESFLERIPVLIREKKVCVGEHIEMVNGKHYERDFIPIFSGDKYLGHLWQFNDITERKNAEQKLKESQERYRQIVESAMDIIYRTDIKGYYSYVNATVFSILGYVEEEVVGKHFTSFIRPDYISQTVEFYKRQVESQTLSSYFEFPVITKDLRQVWIGQNVQMVFENGKHKESSAIARNITDKILAEEKIQKSEEKYRSIIDHMKLGVLEVDIEEKITFAYDRFCQMTSYSAEELMGTHALDLMPVEYLKTFHTKNAERLNGHTGVYEVQIKKKNGQIMWALVSGAPLYDNHQQIIGSLGIHLDITEQKNIEQDLIKERKKAEESSKAKETFLANMSHEIRTPMNAIIGMANLIAGTDLTDKQKGYLEAINTSANNLLVIINDVLDFSKIESGKLALETIGFRLDNTVRSLMQSISYKADEKGISIAANIGTGISPVVIGDSVRLNQVLLNLMINAIKFTSQGHVELQCNLIAETPLIQSIEFKVTDTGIGISEHKLHTIYDSFSQEDESITRRFGGTGLGLSICKQIVELMGGQLHVISEKGKGSTFSFVIDFNKGTESDIEHIREEKKDVSLAGVKVLLVEDHKINRFLALSIMQEWKLVVDVAENGAIAVEKVKSTKYDIILMDMQMPVISGMEASRIIRNELKSAIPIIALTANASKADAAKCLKAGMNGYISKPFNPVHLYNTIAEHVQIEFPVSEEPLVRANMHEKLYDLSKLLTMYNGNKSLINKLIVIFKETTPQTLMQINEYYTHKKLHEVAMLAHQLKPAIDFLGISTLTTHIRFLEKCQLKNTADIQTSIDELNQVLAIVLQQLESEVE